MALDVELAEIRDFLARHAPSTPPAACSPTCHGGMTVEYHRRGRTIITR